MITLQRLNMDSSWKVTMGNSTFLVDPWLTGSEIDGFKWLNEQWHTTEPVSPADVGDFDFILVTQSYDDHCHRETLQVLADDKPILATFKAFHRIRKWFPDRSIYMIDHRNAGLNWQALSFKSFRPKKLLDPIYFAVSISDEAGTIFYAPHGFVLSQKQLKNLGKEPVDLLITTLTDFRLPAILGGHVNPGEENAIVLSKQVNARRIINTHDEQKAMKGLVADFARVSYPDYENLAGELQDRFIRLDDYNAISI